MKNMNILMNRRSHEVLYGFLYGLAETGIIELETALDHLYCCFADEELQTVAVHDDKEYIFQKIAIEDDMYDVIDVWLTLLDKDIIKVYCDEIAQLLSKEYNCEFDFFRECLKDNHILGAIRELKSSLY